MFSRFRVLIALCGGVALIGGCTITIPNDNNNSNGNNNGNGNTGGTTITVRIINQTGATIDPEIYVTGDAVVDPIQLFLPERKYTHYGVGNRGLLGDFDRDEFSLNCADVRVLATKGGIFGDDLDNPDGVGQQRILSQGVTFVCGDVIEFTYSRSGNTFTTTVSLSQ